jgi:Zn-dependent protease with chaperone function
MVELFSTHPSTQHRVERLRKIGEEIGVYVP